MSYKLLIVAPRVAPCEELLENLLKLGVERSDIGYYKDENYKKCPIQIVCSPSLSG